MLLIIASFPTALVGQEPLCPCQPKKVPDTFSGAIDGKPPDPNVDLRGVGVQAIFNGEGHKQRSGAPWDWKFGRRGDEPEPKPAVGEVWEMRGVETGCYKECSEEALREIGLEPSQVPAGASGFATHFEYIAMRRVK